MVQVIVVNVGGGRVGIGGISVGEVTGAFFETFGAALVGGSPTTLNLVGGGLGAAFMGGLLVDTS